jgi:hypothetical protein
MKKSITIIAALALVAGLAFADDAAKPAAPKTEIWGAANLDHFTTGDEVANYSLGNWYFNKARVGINTQASDTVKFVSEFDLVGLDLRLFNATWTPVDGLGIKAGKFMENYSQICGQSRLLGVSVDYDFGPGAVGLAILNKSDVTDFAFSKYGSYSATTAGTATSTAGVYGLKLALTKDAIFEPTVSYDVLDGNGIKLTLGADGQFDYTLATATTDATFITSASGRAVLAIDQLLSWQNEFFYQKIGETDYNMNFYTKVSYAGSGNFKPCAYLYMLNLDSNAKSADKNATQSDTVVVELPYTLAKNFSVDPWASYAFAGNNKYDGVANDWSVGLRLSYSFSSKF